MYIRARFPDIYINHSVHSYKLSPGGKEDVDVEHNPSYGVNYHRPSEPLLAGPNEAVYEPLPL